MVEKALLDSGVMENFLNHHTIKRLRIPTHPLEQPIWLTNVDGTTNQAGRIVTTVTQRDHNASPVSPFFHYVPSDSTYG